MLKALELLGFKSFADKTRFEFPAGITVVVGPNGSGKSNIVDAIKWALGEQSPKSLRGKEMSDVIFKGTGTTGRKPMNTAEATLVFDNAASTLAVDAPEVHITRRVYRSGEGEYSINGKPCRLKDIRDLIRGTGVGAGAYSLIEQGKVDRLLQASPKDRRAIFEEAAGISRFKAKKIEAQRRLDRVDQNLLRLSDIVDEVESRLRSVRAQAAKAQRYRQYSQRLQELRTQVGFADWQHLSQKLEGLQGELSGLQEQTEQLRSQSAALAAGVRESELEAERVANRLRGVESELADNREQIAARQSTLENERARSSDFEEQVQRHRAQVRALSFRAGDLAGRLHEIASQLAKAEVEVEGIRARLDDHEGHIAELSTQLDDVRQAADSHRAEYVQRLRDAAGLENRVSARTAEQQAAQAVIQRCAPRLEQLDRLHAEGAEALERSRNDKSRLARQAGEQAAAIEAAELELAESRHVLARRQEELAVLQGRHTAACQRVKVLEELQQQNAGLGAGVQALLAEWRSRKGGPHSDHLQLHGMVADLIEADVQVAPMVDVALGEAAQHVVVAGSGWLPHLRSGQFQPAGRVALIRRDALMVSTSPLLPSLGLAGRGQLQGRPGVIGRADRLVRTDEPFRPLVRQLLGHTWFVESLEDALVLSRTAARGLRFVTANGELLEANGTLVVGPPSSASGLVARRSQLRTVRQEAIDLGNRIRQFRDEVVRLRENVAAQERQNRRAADELAKVNAALADQRLNASRLEDRQQQTQRERQQLTAEKQQAEAVCQTAAGHLQEARRELADVQASIARLEVAIQTADQRTTELEGDIAERSQKATEAKVELAKSEQRLEGLQTQKSQLETDWRDRDRAIQDAQSQWDAADARRRRTELHVLQITAELAERYLRKESLTRRVHRENQRRCDIQARRAERTAEREQIQQKIHELEQQQHKLELAIGQLEHDRNALADRLRDDYGIEISQIVREVTPEEEQQRAATEAEIADLRNKINRIGAVNLDALDELDELDGRYQSLSGQYQDLTQAKESLERVIHKINADSRRLFTETLEAIRVNFQSLYRRAFGGGHADIVVEQGKDVLESGIDIVATPPGKPSFNNSLLSGGEKAMTAMSLLLAIFQFRPSPFCILDEVDAPFDEANIDRFITVLKDFLGASKFVIVTHSKKTMTAADTIYGVTMQESGVSKRVSVRFEDVSEDGHISEDALRRDQEARQDDERAA